MVNNLDYEGIEFPVFQIIVKLNRRIFALMYFVMKMV